MGEMQRVQIGIKLRLEIVIFETSFPYHDP